MALLAGRYACSNVGCTSARVRAGAGAGYRPSRCSQGVVRQSGARRALLPRRRLARQVVVRATKEDGSDTDLEEKPKSSAEPAAPLSDEAPGASSPQPKRGFTEGKNWGWYFEQEAPENEETANERLRELSHFDKLLAIVVSEAALPGTFAIIACALFKIQPFAYYDVSSGALTMAAVTTLPLLLLDTYLLVQRPRTVADLRGVAVDEGRPSVLAEEDLEAAKVGKGSEKEVQFVYGLSDAVDDYAAFACADLPVLLSDTPTPVLLPAVAAGSAAQELLYRGTLLAGLTYFISDNLRASDVEASNLWWDSVGDVASKLTDAQLLNLPPPPMVLAGEIALAVYIIGLLLSEVTFTGGDIDMTTYDVKEDPSGEYRVDYTSKSETFVLPPQPSSKSRDGNTKVVTKEDLVPNAVTAEAASEGDASQQREAGEGSASGEAEEDGEEVNLHIHFMNTVEDVEGLRSLAHASLRALQWMLTGNLFIPMVSAILSDALWVVLVKHAQVPMPTSGRALRPAQVTRDDMKDR